MLGHRSHRQPPPAFWRFLAAYYLHYSILLYYLQLYTLVDSKLAAHYTHYTGFTQFLHGAADRFAREAGLGR